MPGNHDYDDDYNSHQMSWTPRGVTGMNNDPRMKEMFVELESMINDTVGA